MKDPTSSQILQPTNACQSHPTVINAVQISMQNAVFYNKLCNVINKSYFLTSLKYFKLDLSVSCCTFIIILQ